MSSLYDSIMSDTVGVLYRAGTGKVDPWSQQQIIDQATADCTNAGGDPTTCAQQQAATVDSLTAQPTISWWQSFQDAFSVDNGTGCNVITNPAGCMPSFIDPTYLPWILAGLGVLALLWLVRPFVVAVEE